MIVFEDVEFEIFQFLVAKGTAMMSGNGLVDAGSAVNMSASGDVAVVYGIEANCALELVFQLVSVDSEVVIVQIMLAFDLHVT